MFIIITAESNYSTAYLTLLITIYFVFGNTLCLFLFFYLQVLRRFIVLSFECSYLKLFYIFANLTNSSYIIYMHATFTSYKINKYLHNQNFSNTECFLLNTRIQFASSICEFVKYDDESFFSLGIFLRFEFAILLFNTQNDVETN